MIVSARDGHLLTHTEFEQYQQKFFGLMSSHMTWFQKRKKATCKLVCFSSEQPVQEVFDHPLCFVIFYTFPPEQKRVWIVGGTPKGEANLWINAYKLDEKEAQKRYFLK